MNNFKKLSAAALVALAIFTSCDNNDTPVDPTQSPVSGDVFVINYGGYTGAKTTITKLDTALQTTQKAYQVANNGIEITSNVQHATVVGDEIYYMGNNLDQVFSTSTELVQTSNGTTTDIIKPRFGVADGSILYVSCWGGDIWDDETLSYIAVLNTTNGTVESKIALPGGPEGLAIANGKLYAALNYKDSVAVIDLDDESINYIATPAVTSYFATDNDDNLYVTLISTYSDYSSETGLGYIDTEDDTLAGFYPLDGIFSDYGSVLAFNPDKSELYVASASYNASWQMVGGVSVFNTSTKTFDSEPLVTNILGIGGVAVNPTTSDIYVFVAENTTSAGEMRIFSATGDSLTTQATGISPKWAIFPN